MAICVFVFMPAIYLTVLSAVVIAGGLCFLVAGVRLGVRKRRLLKTPTSRIQSATDGLVEVGGKAMGPNTMPAPITGKPCFLYQTAVWQQSHSRKQKWKKVVDETLHLPFFLEDATGQLLVEPLGAELDLLRDSREEYVLSLVSSADLPPRIGNFLSRHSIAPHGALRIEERLIKPEDLLFITGTVTENPGVPLRPALGQGDSAGGIRKAASDAIDDTKSNHSLSAISSQRLSAPEIIRLDSGETARPLVGQQAKIAAALNRAGITKPEVWEVAGVPYASNVATADAARPGSRDESRASEAPAEESRSLVLMKGADNPTFVISFRSQKEFVPALAWRSRALVGGGAAIILLGIYNLLQMKYW